MANEKLSQKAAATTPLTGAELLYAVQDGVSVSVTVDDVAARASGAVTGADGVDGLSAYQVAVVNGFIGTEPEWLLSLVGADSTVPGPQGEQGLQGIQGEIGPAGADSVVPGPQGEQGLTGETGAGLNILGSYANLLDLQTDHPTGVIGDAYLIAGDLYVWDGVWSNVGNIQGPQGVQGLTGEQGLQGLDGPAGADSIVPGPPGYTPIKDVDYFDGAAGADSVVPGPAGYTPVKGVDYFDGNTGADGLSAYAVAIAAGFVGTESEWLLSLEGPAGADSTVAGPQGVQGVAGETGSAGVGVPVGGTVGQVLAKVDATDYNSAWVDPATGGLTNPMTTAGDIIIGGVSGAPTRLAKGTDGQVLTVVAGVPTYADASGGSATPSVTVSGTLSLYVTLSTTLTITNYDSATTYSVSATAGTATITGDTITYTAGAAAGSVTLTITAGTATRDLAITVNAALNAYITTPTATPAAFGDAFEGGFYTGMIWNELVQTATSTAIGTGSKVFTVVDMTAVPLVYGGQELEIRSRANPANKMIGVVTGAMGTDLTINVTSVGGSGTFTDWSIMAKYRVIVAPKASGESDSKTYKVDNTAAPTACQTLAEGYKATLAMIAAGDATMYPAAWFCKSLNIGTKTDWYLPSRDELELLWRNLKPVSENNYLTANRSDSAVNYTNLGAYDDTVATHGSNNNSSPAGAANTATVPAQVAAGKNFRTGETEALSFVSNRYWSSSEAAVESGWNLYMATGFAGYQSANVKNLSYYVRAVRRSII